MSGHLGGVGWCQNLTHPDHLHVIREECDNPETLEERLRDMHDHARETGSMERLDLRIEAMRTEATRRAFNRIVSNYGPLTDEQEID